MLVNPETRIIDINEQTLIVQHMDGVLADSHYMLLSLSILFFKRDKDILLSFSKLDEVASLNTVYH